MKRHLAKQFDACFRDEPFKLVQEKAVVPEPETRGRDDREDRTLDLFEQIEEDIKGLGIGPNG